MDIREITYFRTSPSQTAPIQCVLSPPEELADQGPPARSGGQLAGLAAHLSTATSAAYAPIAHLAVGDFRNWLLSDAADSAAPGITPEMGAAVSKIMRIQDLVLVPRKRRKVSTFRNTSGLERRLATHGVYLERAASRPGACRGGAQAALPAAAHTLGRSGVALKYIAAQSAREPVAIPSVRGPPGRRLFPIVSGRPAFCGCVRRRSIRPPSARYWLRNIGGSSPGSTVLR